MRLVMAGAGAVGCHYASLLAQAGVDVACLARGEHLRATRAHGLTHICNGVELEHARPTEVDYMNGFVAKRASELGLKAPGNGMLASLIRAREQGGSLTAYMRFGRKRALSG